MVPEAQKAVSKLEISEHVAKLSTMLVYGLVLETRPPCWCSGSSHWRCGSGSPDDTAFGFSGRRRLFPGVRYGVLHGLACLPVGEGDAGRHQRDACPRLALQQPRRGCARRRSVFAANATAQSGLKDQLELVRDGDFRKALMRDAVGDMLQAWRPVRSLMSFLGKSPGAAGNVLGRGALAAARTSLGAERSWA